MCGLAQTLTDQGRRFAASVGQDDEEFFPAVTKDHVDIAQLLLDRRSHGLEYLVAGAVAVAVIDALEVIDIQHQQRQWLVVASCQFDFPLQGLLHGDAVAGFGQWVTQGALGRGAIEQGITHRIEQAGQQGFQIAQLLFGKALVTAKQQIPHVFAFMAEAIGRRMMAALAEFQAQVAGLMGVAQ